MFELDAQQKAIVQAPVEGAMRVFAGPGAGKTATMTHRISYLIEQGIKPDEITAVSFSRVAANELGERAEKLNPAVNLRQICTIHALANRGLRRAGDGRDLAVGKKSYLRKKHANGSLEKLGITEIGWRDFMRYINHAKSQAIRPERLETFYEQSIQHNGGLRIYVTWEQKAHTLLAEAHRNFDRMLRSENLMTFADMLVDFEWLLEDNEAELDYHCARTNFLMIDEAQDTNPQSMRILYQLASPQDNVMVIGDPDQAIFSFIGAQAERNMQFGFEERFPEHETYMLETNYRSTEAIVDFVHKAIDGNYGSHNVQYKKTLTPGSNADEGVETTYRTFSTPEDEAAAVANLIADEVYDGDRMPDDFFVVARVRAILPYLYSELFHKRIPFVDRNGGSFWATKHIQQLVHYLRLDLSKSDDLSFQTVYNVASSGMQQPFDLKNRETGNIIRFQGEYVNHRWLGKAFLEDCQGSWYLMANADRRSYQPGIRDFRDFMDHLGRIDDVNDKIEFIIDKCLQPYWMVEEGGHVDQESNRIVDLRTVAEMASKYGKVEDFLTYVSEMEQAVLSKEDEDRAVVLSTIHKVKGAERPVVFVMGVMNGVLPHWTTLTDNRGNFGEGVLPFNNKNSIEDERRLFFVAASRAKEEIHCTGAFHYLQPTDESMFAFETGLAGVPEEI